MNLNQTAANIRPRSPYEAIDLGTTMVREWWKELWLIWFSVSLPFALLFWFALYDYRSWTILAIWWCKPLWETPLLHFIAEKLFNSETSAKDILRRTPRLLSRDILLKLTLRRLSITRSFDMPVSELEQLHGTTRNKRLNILHRTSSSAAIWLTVIGAHLESIIVMALISAIWLFIPEYMALDLSIFDVLIEDDYQLLRFIFGYLAMSCVAPFYVASGFCLYINRRTILEGWDIELRFKQLASRVGQTLGVIAVAILVASPLISNDAMALEDSVEHKLGYSPKQSREDIIDVLESESFNRIEVEEFLLPKNRHDEIEEEEDPTEFFKGIEKYLAIFAQVVEVILWGLLIAAIIYVAIKLNQYRMARANGPESKKLEKAPDTLFGLDIRKGSLPANITEAALASWADGNFREAYSYLYRGALVYITHEKAVPLHESFTEEECVAQFQDYDDGLETLFFAQLTQQWQMVAYGHQPPSTSIFESACEGWQFHFGGANEQ